MYPGELPTVSVLARTERWRRDHPFLVDSDRALTFSEALDAVSRAAHGLERLGVARGTPVLVVLEPRVEYPVVMIALHALGALSINVNPDYARAELEYLCENSKPEFVVTEAGLAAPVAEAVGDLPLVVLDEISGDVGRPVVAWAEVCDAEAPDQLLRPGVTADDAATVIYTSGTVGRPKGVVYRQGSHGFAGEYGAKNFGITANDVCYVMMPFFHGTALSNLLFPAMIVGATVAIERFSASGFEGSVIRHRATVTAGGAPHWRMVLANADAPVGQRLPDSRLRLVISGMPMRDDEYEAFESRFGCRFVEIFGQTEGVVPTTMQPLHGPPKRRTAGVAGLGSEFRIVDEDGVSVGPGVVGELEYITHGAGGRFLGYLNRPEVTAEVLTEDGWIRSGDASYVDDDGYLNIVDRMKDVVKVGGENVSASEVERVLNEHPSVVESAVVGVPDPMLGKVVHAFVVYRDGEVAPDDVLAFCSERLAKFKVPRALHQIDALPRNTMGKVTKSELPSL